MAQYIVVDILRFSFSVFKIVCLHLSAFLTVFVDMVTQNMHLFLKIANTQPPLVWWRVFVQVRRVRSKGVKESSLTTRLVALSKRLTLIFRVRVAVPIPFNSLSASDMHHLVDIRWKRSEVQVFFLLLSSFLPLVRSSLKTLASTRNHHCRWR